MKIKKKREERANQEREIRDKKENQNIGTTNSNKK